MTRVLAAIAVLAAGAAALVLTGAAPGGGGGTGKRYDVVLDNAFGLVEGGELKIGGVRAGRTVGFRLTEREPYKAIAEVEVTEPGFDSLRTDARCDVRQQSLIGEYFLDCTLGQARQELPDGGAVPVRQTSSTIPPDLVNNIMRRPYRERFRLILNELGTGLAGRAEELNEVIRRAHPGLRETTQTIRILRRQNKEISDFIAAADRVSAEVEPKKHEVARWAAESSETASIQASRASSIKAQWNKLPRFLGELEPTLAQLERTVDRQLPLLERLRVAAPDLDRFLAELGPFAEASRGATAALGRSAVTGRKAVGEAIEEVAQLRELAKDAPELAKPLRQLLQTIDDRERSIEDDPLAEKLAPPAPDKTAYKQGQGFTGMEALWNYIYYQTLAINPFDQLGHVLRIVAIQNNCAAYATKPTPEQRAKCSSGLGPYAPGVADPDPSQDASVKETEERERRAARRGEPVPRLIGRGPGEPKAPPTPGKPDLSKPQIVLPPELQQLLDSLPKGLDDVPKTLPDLGSRSAEPLLDYLLGR